MGRKSWPVHLWGEMSKQNHSHRRHPQVLVLEFEGVRTEFIGMHLNSKINRKRPFTVEMVQLGWSRFWTKYGEGKCADEFRKEETAGKSKECYGNQRRKNK